MSNINDFIIEEESTLLFSESENKFEKTNVGVLKAYNGTDKDIVIPDGIYTIDSEFFNKRATINSITIPNSVRNIRIEESKSKIKKVFINDLEAYLEINWIVTGWEVQEKHHPFVDYELYLNNEPVTDLVVPDSVAKMGEGSISHCKSIESIYIPDSVREFSGVYSCISLKKLRIPDHLAKELTPDDIIDQYSWENLVNIYFDNNANLMEAELRKKVRGFIQKKKEMVLNLIFKNKYNKKRLYDNGKWLTGYLNMKKKRDLDEVDALLKKAEGNPELTAIIIDYKNKHFSDEEITQIEQDNADKALGFKEMSLKDWQKIFRFSTKNGEVTVSGYKGKDTEVIIPDTIAGKPVRHIGKGGFNKCSTIFSVVIPDGVVSIEDGAFNGCKGLKSIIIPKSVTSIGSCAFKECKKLKTVVLPDGITEIAWELFYGCISLDNIVVPEGVKKICNYAFCGCKKLKNVLLPDGLNQIAACAFSGCGFSEIVIPDSVSKIGNAAFSGCRNLKTFIVPIKVKTISTDMLQGCEKLKSVEIHNKVRKIEYGAFIDCLSLKKITIPSSVKSIDEYAFIEPYISKDSLTIEIIRE